MLIASGERDKTPDSCYKCFFIPLSLLQRIADIVKVRKICQSFGLTATEILSVRKKTDQTDKKVIQCFVTT